MGTLVTGTATRNKPTDPILKTNTGRNTQSEKKEEDHNEDWAQNQQFVKDCGFDGHSECEYEYEDDELLN